MKPSSQRQTKSHHSENNLQEDSADGKKSSLGSSLFDNLPELIKPTTAASVLGISIKTLYDWKYRYHQRKVPQNLFVKINRMLLIRTDILKQWIASQNPSLQCEG